MTVVRGTAARASWLHPCSADSLLMRTVQIANLDLPKAVILGNHDAWVSSAVGPE